MPRRKALTLVELLAGLAIAGLLAVAALAVTTTLARTEAIGRHRHAATERRAALGRLLRADLLNATRFRETSRGFRVETAWSLASDDLAPAHLPAVVSYEVDQVGGRPCLLRRQRSEFQPPVAELVAADVRQIGIEPVGSQPKALGGGWRTVEEAVAVTVEWGTETAETFELLVRRR
jgi:prepilin-type N-terminal cleavage/methylation domain-containing protein